MKIILAITVFNCKKQIIRVLKSLTISPIEFYEIIIISNASTDNTDSVIIDYLKENSFKNIKLYRNPINVGLGGSHKYIFNYVLENGYDSVVIMHGDDQANIKDLKKISNKIDNSSIYLGSRFLKQSKLIGYSKHRIFGNIFLHLMYKLIASKTIHDMGSGLNVYPLKLIKLKLYNNCPNGMIFHCKYLLEMLDNMNLEYFPIEWRETDQISNAKLFKQVLQVLKLLIVYRFFKKKYSSLYSDYNLEYKWKKEDLLYEK